MGLASYYLLTHFLPLSFSSILLTQFPLQYPVLQVRFAHTMPAGWTAHVSLANLSVANSMAQCAMPFVVRRRLADEPTELPGPSTSPAPDGDGERSFSSGVLVLIVLFRPMYQHPNSSRIVFFVIFSWDQKSQKKVKVVS